MPIIKALRRYAWYKTGKDPSCTVVNIDTRSHLRVKHLPIACPPTHFPYATVSSYHVAVLTLRPLYQGQIARTAIETFMDRTGIPFEPCPPRGGPLERRVREVVQEWAFVGIPPARLEASLIAGIDISGIAYGHTHLDTQVYIALFTFLATCFDDNLASEDGGFTARFHAGLPQEHPFEQRFAEILHETGKHFPPFATGAIVNSALAYMDRNVLDRESKELDLHNAAQQYVEWKRTKNGMAEAYAFFIWDRYSFPSVYTYIQAIP